MTLKTKINTASISFLLTGSILVISSVPANAAPLEEFEPEATAPQTAQIETQSYTVSAAAVPVSLERDGYSATSQADLDAARLAAEEAARKAAEEQAAAEAAARAAERRANTTTTGNGYTAVNKSGVTPGQVVPASGIIAAAQSWVGVVPYGHGNHPSDSFACDGYVQYVFAQNGISLPRGVDSQARQGTVIPRSEAQAGDLVVWPGQHIAIYDGTGGYYHSPNWGRFVEHSATINWGNPVIVRL
jgi:cell wall-associated NlpC family hydrolase